MQFSDSVIALNKDQCRTEGAMKHDAKTSYALTADEILAISPDNPEKIFEPDLNAITKVFRDLSKKWYPDFNPDTKAAEVQQRLLDLRDKAKEKLDNNEWQQTGFYSCKLVSGKTFRVRADISRPFDLGTMHVGPTTITYVFDQTHADFAQTAEKTFKKLTFADDKMKQVFAPALPTTFQTYEARKGIILTIRKKPDDIVLRDLLPFMKGADFDRHIAWVTSRLQQMARYLDYIGIVHNAITLDNVFASPSDHTIGLFGGWWYAAQKDTPLIAVPQEAEPYLSEETLQTGMADPKLDLEMIRAAAREALGDRGGTRLALSKAAPAPMLDYLKFPSSGDAHADYQRWYDDVLPRSFGPHRFIKLDVRYDDVYKGKGVQP